MNRDLEYETRTFDLGEWLPGPWAQGQKADDTHEVVHQATGTVIATLPSWAGGIALWMCVARDAVPALLKDNDQLRAENEALRKQLKDTPLTGDSA